MNLPTDTLSLIDWAVTILVPILIGWIVSKALERTDWFNNVQAKNAIVIAASALTGTLLTILKQWLIQNPDTLAAVDQYVKLFLSTLMIYLSSQVTHGVANANARAKQVK